MGDDRLQVVESPGPFVSYVLSAVAVTLLVGKLLGIILWASRGGIAFPERPLALIQAHGWTRLAGWSGLFVAGFSLRLLSWFDGFG